MSSRFNKPCQYPRCRNLTKSIYCEEHQPKEERASSHERGYDGRWRKYRIGFLAKNPLCVSCLNEGRTTLATVVDHIKAHKGRYKLFWDSNNHQALCKSCHDKKTASEDMQSWNTHKGLQ